VLSSSVLENPILKRNYEILACKISILERRAARKKINLLKNLLAI
jgi:hypothetical protein